MNRTAKIILIISSIAVIAGAVGIAVSRSRKNKKDAEDKKRREEEGKTEESPIIPDSSGSTPTTKPPVLVTSKTKPHELVYRNLGTAGVSSYSTYTNVNNLNGYKITFYDNSRYAITKITGTSGGTVYKGSYKDGGKELIPDSGAKVKSSNVWNNLNSVLADIVRQR